MTAGRRRIWGGQKDLGNMLRHAGSEKDTRYLKGGSRFMTKFNAFVISMVMIISIIL